MTKDRGGRIELIQFHEDQLAAIKLSDGKGYVVVKRICENLGVDYSSQLAKLKRTCWAGIQLIATPDERGRIQEHAVIAIDLLPMWLATINPGKVAPEIRGKVELYQVEAADVLARHFIGEQPTRVDLSNDPLMIQAKMLVSMLERQAETHQLAVNANVIASEAKATADAALSTVSGDTGYMAMVGWCRLHDIGMHGGQINRVGQKLAAFCKAYSIPTRKAHHEVWGEVNSYPVEVLRERVGTHCRRDGNIELLQPGLRVLA